ncbi:MAG: hypothetical protein ACREMH_10200 [Gemmatimonadales bacterium]
MKDKLMVYVGAWATIAVAGVLIAGTALAGKDFAIPAILMLGIGGTIVLRGPLGRALARRIEGQASEVVDLEPVMHELDELRARMAELEERQDFTERLLAREREQVQERLPPA